MSGLRKSRRLVAAGGAVAVGAGLLVAPTVASATVQQAAPAEAAGDPGKAKPFPSAYVAKTSKAVSVASKANAKRKSKAYRKARVQSIARTGSGNLVITMRGVLKPVLSDSQSGAGRTVASSRAEEAFAALGDKPAGVVTAQSKSGKSTRVPVVITKTDWLKKKKRLKVWASPTEGKLPARAQEYAPHLFGLDKASAKGEFRQVTVTAFQAGSKTWKWTDIGSGSVSGSGSGVTVKLNGSGSVRGTQPNGMAAGMTGDNLAGLWQKMTAEGVSPRLFVTGVTSKRKTRTAVLTASSVTGSGDSLEVKGAVKGGSLPSGKQAKLAVTLETPGNGVTKRFVVITGDSIASGEGASYAGTYINPTLGVTPGSTKDDETSVRSWLLAQSGTGDDVVDDALGTMKQGMVEFCKKIDLACVKAELDADGKVVYQRDKSKVYEKGSYEHADSGEACHRSKTAPGTWLARYYKTQQKLDVESINLACSGATTANILSEKFKGERPQREDLKDLSDWLPVKYVVNTIGANDIGFQDLAIECFFGPINALLPGALSGGGFDSSSLSQATIEANITRIVDDVASRRKPDGTLAAVNPNFDPRGLCSEKERVEVEERLHKVRGDIAEALRALHEAAPDAQIVQSNYPSLVPASTFTYLPRQELWSTLRNGLMLDSPDGFWSKVGDCESALKRPEGQIAAFLSWCRLPKSERNKVTTQYREVLTYGVDAVFPQGPPAKSDLWPKGKLPQGEPNPDLEQGAIEGNPWNKLIMDNFWAFSPDVDTPSAGQKQMYPGQSKASPVFQNWLFAQKPLIDLLTYGALLFGPDSDWAAEEVIAGLNEAVDFAVADVDPKGDFITPVDMTQAFNGREFGGKFTGHEMSPSAVVLGYDEVRDQNSGQVTMPATWDTATPANSRAQFVTTLFAGQTLPYLCPGGPDGLDIVAGAAKPRCIGDYQENLHPNWRGQAAEGQCIVAVVTRAYGQGGNACVRSIGTDNGAKERTYPDTADKLADANAAGGAPVLFSEVDGEDSLCLTSLEAAREAARVGQHLKCTSTAPADPTWDTERWDTGKVTDGTGQKVAWR